MCVKSNISCSMVLKQNRALHRAIVYDARTGRFDPHSPTTIHLQTGITRSQISEPRDTSALNGSFINVRLAYSLVTKWRILTSVT